MADRTTQTAMSRHQWCGSSLGPVWPAPAGAPAGPGVDSVAHAATFMKPPM